MNQLAQGGAQQPPVFDEEIVATMFQLARSGRFRSAKALMQETRDLFPDEPKDRISDCLQQLDRVLRTSDHGGYASLSIRKRTRH